MRWFSATSPLPDSAAAAEAACDAILGGMQGESLDLALAFLSADHVPAAEAIADVLRRRLAPGCLAAASARGIVSTEHEIETAPALTVLGAHLPGVTVNPWLVVNDGWEEALSDAAAFARAMPGIERAELVVLLGDPFSLDVGRVLEACRRHAPQVRVVGGLASAGVHAGSNALVLNDWIASEGGFALAFEGALRVDVIVSQGCRPIGPPLRVTALDGHVVLELDGQPALERAEQVLRALPAEERDRLQHGLYIGRPARAGASGPGDYLIRNLLGADRDRGALAVGDTLREGEHIRLHVRDAETAREDLAMLLTPQVVDTRAHAALLFACNGRGKGLHGVADGDIGALQGALGGGVPAGGMFCAGEIGPVGGRSHLHGHTASIAVIRPQLQSPAPASEPA